MDVYKDRDDLEDSKDAYVLSIRQPWAGMVIAGMKVIKCCNWSPQVIKPRDRLYIHAGGKVDKRAHYMFTAEGLLRKPPEAGWDITTTGAVLGYVTYEGIRKYSTDKHFYSDHLFHLCRPGIYARTEYGLMLKNPVRFVEPVVRRGKLGIFTVPMRLLVEGVACHKGISNEA